ncbi:hypothetical protein HJG54_17865 [Leptolyngbya sp. NK1-12]|uniref:Uncharacterized protein n=1 Tax=Leptolyngbya sp. NK1-12 TaxID=2547451 RepID=A0AA96WGB4_9CYAN|nr:hypothetical protein [Leptolyngbya sp. NK1-12]WNZ24534.1 hypothetical protein HJG54_17865 [Leptolyngbya sp. NK1-12]
MPTIEGLTDFAQRFRRVSEVAEKLDQLDAITVTRWLVEHPEAIRSILDFDPTDSTNRGLIERLSQVSPPVRFSRENIVRIAEAPPEGIRAVSRTGQEVRVESPIFLEIGSNTLTSEGQSRGAGLVHILAAHADDFENRGIPKEQLADFLVTALTQGRDIGNQGQDASRVVYEVNFNGSTHYASITVGDNGFIVGANPTPSDLINRLLNP